MRIKNGAYLIFLLVQNLVSLILSIVSKDHLSYSFLNNRVNRSSCSMIRTNKSVVTTSSIQILVDLGRLGFSSNIHPVTVCYLSSSESHSLGPDVVSQLGRDDLSIVKKGRAWVLSIVLDCFVFCAVEVSVPKVPSKCWHHGYTEVVGFS